MQPGRNVQIPEQCQAEASQPEMVACAVEAFLARLSEEQRSQVLLPLAQENSTAWSNLPCGSSCRVGLPLANLSDEQVAAALAVVKAATSDYGDDGFHELTQVMMADDILGVSQGEGGGPPLGPPPGGAEAPPRAPTMGGSGPPPGGGPGGYASNLYFIAVLGTPGGEEPWQLQFGGHHLALLKTYQGTAEMGDTPAFTGVEPKVWADGDRTYAPLEDDRSAMVAMLASLSADQLGAAFSDVLLGSGADGQFPATKQGLALSELSDEQKQLVLAAIGEWVGDTATASADQIMADCQAQLDATYIAYSGHPELTAHADYVRIDGPRVWIEFVCQNGVVYRTKIHYHTIWRDHETDYGAVYSF